MTRLRLRGDSGSARDALLSMLVEPSVVEQRYQEVLAVIRDGVAILGTQAMTHVAVRFETIGGADICRIDVYPAADPVYVDGRRLFLRVK